MYDIKICKVTFVNLRVVSKLSTMVDRLVRNVPSQRGKVNLEDSNQFRYCNNGEGKFTTRWRCSKRSCPATLTTRNSTGNLTDPTLPDHNHANKLMKMVAKQTEKAVLDKFTPNQQSKPSAVLQEISSNMLSSNFPGILFEPSF